MVVFKQLNQFKMHSPMPIAKVAQIVTLLLVIWFGWILGRLLWTVIQPTETVTSWQPSQTQSVGQQQKFPVSDLIAMNLFGLYQQSAQPVATPVKQDAPETRLNLTLNGVVASSNPEKALAIITNQGKQNTYGLNEAIKGTRATLQAVYADRVIIRNSGSDETLMLDGVKFSKTSTATQPTAPVTTQSSSSSGELEKIKAEIMKNPQNLFSYIRLSQVKNDSKLMGYRVNPGKNKILFDEVGLEPNDLAVTLNGNDLTDPTVMTKLWSELSQASSFTLGVERDGQLHDIYIELQ